MRGETLAVQKMQPLAHMAMESKREVKEIRDSKPVGGCSVGRPIRGFQVFQEMFKQVSVFFLVVK